MAIPLLASFEMRELDRITIEEIGIPGAVLMECAGRACAEAVEELLPDARPGRVAVVCGKGNNGGDGLVAARHLHHAGHRIDVVLLAEPEQLKGEAALNAQILERLHIPIRKVATEEDARKLQFGSFDVVLDAILGTGLAEDVKGLLAAAIEAINAAAVPVVAVDIPSGISADSGRRCGVAVRAKHTVTFAYPKPGHLLYPGAAHTGDLTVVDIGIPPDLLEAGPERTWLFTDEDVAPHLQRREPDSHKGRFGHLLVVAGSVDKPGAAGLCCRAALRSGVGLVTLAAPREVLDRVVSGAIEYMGMPLDDAAGLLKICAGNKQAVAIGPGLGAGSREAALVRQAAAKVPLPMVIDADGLNNLVDHLDVLKKAPAARILTPHPGEMARLIHKTTAEIQRDRLGCTRKLAGETGCVVVLKGAGTVVATPDSTAVVIPTGNPGMATGGTGDVLTGVIGSLLCQGLDIGEAAAVGAYVHGLAGDEAAMLRGQHGLVATDLIDQLPAVLRRFEEWDDEDPTGSEQSEG